MDSITCFRFRTDRILTRIIRILDLIRFLKIILLKIYDFAHNIIRWLSTKK